MKACHCWIIIVTAAVSIHSRQQTHWYSEYYAARSHPAWYWCPQGRFEPGKRACHCWSNISCFLCLSQVLIQSFTSILPFEKATQFFRVRRGTYIPVQTAGSLELNVSHLSTSVCQAQPRHSFYLTICTSFKSPHVTLHRRRLEDKHVSLFYRDGWHTSWGRAGMERPSQIKVIQNKDDRNKKTK